jgi:Na+/H+-dicarboxylate symporter
MARLRFGMTAQVFLGMAVGVALGLWLPELAAQLGFVNEIFVRLVKLVISPIVFITLVTGMAGMGSLKQVGLLGARALIYFEVCTSLALGVGIALANWWRPGSTLHQDAPVVVALPLATPVAHADWHAFPRSRTTAWVHWPPATCWQSFYLRCCLAPA